MQFIFDPDDRWIGSPPLALRLRKTRPVAVTDTIHVLKDSGPTIIDVLANDFDPDGGSLVLVSAFAALGLAVVEPDDTVSYTPPAGISGFDTITYEIANQNGARRTGQVDITITEPQLAVDITAGNTLEVTAENGTIDIAISAPSDFADVYQMDVSALGAGPVALAPPGIEGLVAADEILTATPGLWAHRLGGNAPLRTWQWRRDGEDIPGQTGSTYVVRPEDIGPGLNVVETLSDSFGQGSAESSTVGFGFMPSDDPSLLGWWDAADTATVSASQSGGVSSWADKAGGSALFQNSGTFEPTTGARTLNGLNVIDFGGTAFLERSQSVPASGNIAFHMALVIDQTSNAFEAVLALEATNDFQIDALNASQFDGRLNTAGIGTAVNLSGGPFAGPMILSAVFDRTGAGTAEVWIHDGLRGSTAYVSNLDQSALLYLMSNRSENALVNGAVAEVIITGDVSNRADMHSYLANKWGLS